MPACACDSISQSIDMSVIISAMPLPELCSSNIRPHRKWC